MSKRRKTSRGNPANPPAATRPASRQPGAGGQQGRVRAAPEEQSQPKILVYAVLGIALFMGLYLHAYAMPQLTHFADGQPMPGARFLGYDAAEIESLRAVLEDDAAGQLNFLNKTAGIIFPVTFLLATWAVMGLLARGTWRWVVTAAAVVFAVVDIVENFLVDGLMGGDSLHAGAVPAASAMTTLSWVLLAVIGAVVVAVVVWEFIDSGRRQAQAT